MMVAVRQLVAFLCAFALATNAQTVTTHAGTLGTAGSADGTGTAASFGSPTDLAIHSDGIYSYLLVTDRDNHVIRKLFLDSGDCTTVAGTKGTSGSADGYLGSFNKPEGIAINSEGTTALVTDQGNQLIRSVNLGDNTVSLVAGSYGSDFGGGDYADGTGTNAKFKMPAGIAYSEGETSAFVADMWNQGIREIVLDSRVVTTLVGANSLGSGLTDGSIAEALFFQPQDLSVYTDWASWGETLLIADKNNHAIRRVILTESLIDDALILGVQTLAGDGGTGSADGIGGAAQFNNPGSIAISSDGAFAYIADHGNHAIRELVTWSNSMWQYSEWDDDDQDEGSVSTVAGSKGESGSADGTGTSASFNSPGGIVVSEDGTTLYVADTRNHAIRKIGTGRNDNVLKSPGKKVCFPELATVQVEGKQGPVTMDQVKIGDRLLVAFVDGTLGYSPVADLPLGCDAGWGPCAFTHRVSSAELQASKFVTLTSASGHTIRLSPDHMLPIAKPGQPATVAFSQHVLVPASRVAVGDNVFVSAGAYGGAAGDTAKSSTVVAAEEQTRPGAYNFHTAEGTIVVDGVVASSFTTRSWPLGYGHVIKPMQRLHQLASFLGVAEA